ncbi:MAG: hypothetical protein ABIS86_14205 [Streptosporangiaceae bacterium]
MSARQVAVVAVTLTGVGFLAGCAQGDEVEERSFVDQHGRACAYVLVVDREDSGDDGGPPDLDVGDVDCDYPPSPFPTGGARP